MKEKLTIITECFVDTTLAETITNCYNRFNHQSGCNKVCSVMQNKLVNNFALGIIDKDKREVSYLKEFDLIVTNNSLYLYKHKIRSHYIIQIAPAIEKFFIKAAEEKGVDIATYGLPTELKKLTKITKQIADEHEEDFKKFQRLFKELSDTSEFKRLSNLIIYLNEKTYKADIEELKLFYT